MELSHPLKTLSFPWFCQVTHEAFPMLILSTLIKKRRILAVLSVLMG